MPVGKPGRNGLEGIVGFRGSAFAFLCISCQCSTGSWHYAMTRNTYSASRQLPLALVLSRRLWRRRSVNHFRCPRSAFRRLSNFAFQCAARLSRPDCSLVQLATAQLLRFLLDQLELAPSYSHGSRWGRPKPRFRCEGDCAGARPCNRKKVVRGWLLKAKMGSHQCFCTRPCPEMDLVKLGDETRTEGLS